MKRLLACALVVMALAFTFACNKNGTCVDGQQNQGESGVDCGGPCPACGTCSDGIKNQSETAIDCGGVCSPCPTCSDGIQNQGEPSIDCGGPCQACSIVFPDSGFYGRNILKQIPNDTILINEMVSLTAKLSAGNSLTVRLHEIVNTSPSWGIPQGEGSWHNDYVTSGKNYQHFYAVGPILADRPIVVWINVTAGRMFAIEYFFNGSKTPGYVKSVYWK